MSEVKLKSIWFDGLWHNNPGLVQLLGLCPLLAVTNTTVNGLGLGLATLLVLTGSNFIVSLTRHWLTADVRIPAFVLIIASLVTAIDMSLQAWLPGLRQNLGIFVPLIVTNCTLLARAEAFASRRAAGPALIDGLAQGLGFALVLIALGAMRELLGQGTLLADAELLFGPRAESLTLQVIPEGWGLLLAILPPGAFILLGLMVALRQTIVATTARAAARGAQAGAAMPPEASRAS